MGTNGLKVRPDEMEQLGVKTCSESGTYAQNITNIGKTKTSLMGIWHGDAAETFSGKVDEQVKNMNDLEEVLNKMGEAIQRGAETFRTNEESQVKKAESLLDETRVGI